MQKQVLPRFGDAPLRAITNGGVRKWVSDPLTSGLSAATTRKAVFALRQCLAAAIADNRLQFNPGDCDSAPNGTTEASALSIPARSRTTR